MKNSEKDKKTITLSQLVFVLLGTTLGLILILVIALDYFRLKQEVVNMKNNIFKLENNNTEIKDQLKTLSQSKKPQVSEKPQVSGKSQKLKQKN